jgi:hypothetical protein
MNILKRAIEFFGVKPQPSTQNFSGQVARKPEGINEPVLAIARAFTKNPKRFKFSMVSRAGNNTLLGTVRDTATGESMTYRVHASTVYIQRHVPGEPRNYDDTKISVHGLKWYAMSRDPMHRMHVQLDCNWMSLEEKIYLSNVFIEVMHIRLTRVWENKAMWR